AEKILQAVRQVNGVVDARIIQRLDYPQFIINVDRAKASQAGLNQAEVMKNVVAAFNSSIQFNKKNFWIDPKTHNQYHVGVQYPEGVIESTDTLLDIPITSPKQSKPIPLRNIATLERISVPSEVTHANLQPTIDLEMGVYGRDLGHVSDDVTRAVARFGRPEGEGVWAPYDPEDPSGKRVLPGSKIVLSGEYAKMQNTFRDMGFGLILAVLLVYF